MVCLSCVAGVHERARFLIFVKADDVAFLVFLIFPAKHALQGNCVLNNFHESFLTCIPMTCSCVLRRTNSLAHPYRKCYMKAVGVLMLGLFEFCVELFMYDGGSYGSRRCSRLIRCGVVV